MPRPPVLDLDEYWRPVHSQGVNGTGVTVGVIDTGADSETYEKARKMNENARRYTGLEVQWGWIEKLWISGDARTDDLRHGSAVFKRLLAGAPGSFFLDIRTLLPNCSDEDLLQSLSAARGRGADILNLSLGRMVPWSKAKEHAQSCRVCDLTNRLAAECDILVLAAVGNWADQGVGCPALGENVVAVGSVMTEEETAFYRENPGQQFRDFIEGRSSTSFASAMASALYAVLRSALPAISASNWLKFIRSNKMARSVAPQYHEPDALLSELRTICGGWMANYADWKEFGIVGITNRRELLAQAFGSGVKGYPKLREWLTAQEERFQIFIEGQSAFAMGREGSQTIATVGNAIGQFRVAVAKFKQIEETIRTAAARISLGNVLINKSWMTVPGHVIINDAAEAESELCLALDELQTCSGPNPQVLKGSALAWRARARTVLAAVSPPRNNDALSDANKAVELLSAGPSSAIFRHELAIAHLHLARAHYYAAWLNRQRGYSAGRGPELVRMNAARAMELSKEDDYVQKDANWLIRNAEGSTH